MDLQQKFQLLKARMPDAELLDAISDVLYERGDLGEVVDLVTRNHNQRMADLRARIAAEARESAIAQMRGGMSYGSDQDESGGLS